MINFDNYTNENKTTQKLRSHNSKWPYIPDHPYRVLIVRGSGSGKPNALLALINNHPDIDEIYLYARDPYEVTYQFLINKRESTGSKCFKMLSVSIQMICKMFSKILVNTTQIKNVSFDDTIADMINKKKLNSIVTEEFIRGRKLNISLVFIMQSYFKVPKDVRLNSTHFFIMKIPNKRELQQIALNHSSDIIYKDFFKIYKKCTAEQYSFAVNDITLASDNPLRFRKNLFSI